MLYSYSFEQNPDWTREYPGQEEILVCLQRFANISLTILSRIIFKMSPTSINFTNTFDLIPPLKQPRGMTASRVGKWMSK
jgi:hypothetical protein